MAETRLTCPSCAASLKLAAALAPGKKVKCPKCASIITVPQPDADTEVQAPRPAPAVPAKTAPAAKEAVRPRPAPPPADEGDENDFENLSARPPARVGAKPAPKKPADEDEGDEELLTKKPAKKGKKGSPLVFWGIIGGGALVIAGGFVAFMWMMGVFGGTSIPGITRKTPPPDTTPYAVKIKYYPEVGKKVNVVQTMDTVTAMREYDGEEIKKETTTKQAREEEYTLTILEMEGSRPKKFKRTYKKAISKQDDKETALPYQNRTIVFELEGGKYKASVESGLPLSPKDLAELVASANKDLEADPEKVLLPKSTVKIDEKWDLDNKALAAMFGGLQSNSAEITGHATLDRVHDKDGKKFGVIEATIKLPLRKTGKTEPPVMEVQLTFEGVLDGSAPVWSAKAVSTMTMTTPRKDGKGEVVVTSTLNAEQTEAP